MGGYLANLAHRSGPLRKAQGNHRSSQYKEGPPEASDVRYLQPRYDSTPAAQAEANESLLTADSEISEVMVESDKAGGPDSLPESSRSSKGGGKGPKDSSDSIIDPSDATEERRRPAKADALSAEKNPRRPRQESKDTQPKPRVKQETVVSEIPDEVAILRQVEVYEVQKAGPKSNNRQSQKPVGVPRAASNPDADVKSADGKLLQSVKVKPDRMLATDKVLPRYLPELSMPHSTRQAQQVSSDSVTVRIGRIEVQVKPPKQTNPVLIRREVSTPSEPPRHILRRSYLREF